MNEFSGFLIIQSQQEILNPLSWVLLNMTSSKSSADSKHLPVPLLDLKAQYASIRGEIETAVKDVLESQLCILGPKVEACEKAVAEYSQCAYGIGVSSGTDALLLALMAEGIGAGDEVITTPYTFFATAGSIARVGAKPVFVDIDPVTFNLDVRLLDKAVTPKTKAMMPVHLYGQMADMDPILALAKKYHLLVIEDAAQAIGSEYQGKRAGSMGDYGCFSFFPSKNLGAVGDAGMIVTQDAAKAARLKIFRNHGSEPKYFHSWIGGNFRLDAIQAAVVNAKLPHLDAWTLGRQKNAERYFRLFEKSGLLKSNQIRLPEPGKGRHIFNQFVIQTLDRDALKDYLKAQKIDTEIYYPLPLHLQDCFRYLGYKKGDFPESEKAALTTLALPIYPELTDAQAVRVVEAIRDFYHS